MIIIIVFHDANNSDGNDVILYKAKNKIKI